MAGQYGVSSTRNVLRFLVSMTAAVIKARENGKVDATDIPLFLGPVTEVIPAVAGIKDVPKEWAELDEEDKKILQEEFAGVVEDGRFQRAFSGIVETFDAIYEIITVPDPTGGVDVNATDGSTPPWNFLDRIDHLIRVR